MGDPATSWYALLRLTQGDPAAIVDCGYIVRPLHLGAGIGQQLADLQHPKGLSGLC
jgi:hypothetical protein